MLNTIWEKLKSFAKWVYNWITVLFGIFVAGVATMLDQLDQITGIDFSAFVSPKRAAQIVAGVALTKAILSIISAIKAKFKAA